MQIGRPTDITIGGACSWQLPTDPSCAQFSRSTLRAAMTELHLPGDLTDNVLLCASELATNSFRHCVDHCPREPVIPPELSIWARTTPSKQLVLAVFDNCRNRWPDIENSNPMAESGRGLDIVAATSHSWGAHASRSRFGPWRVPGKTVWGAFPLPGLWPDSDFHAEPAHTARYLASTLHQRGITEIRCRHERNVSLVVVPLNSSACMNIWIEPKALIFFDPDRTRIWRPLLDLHDVAEHLIRRIEEHNE